MSFDVSWFTFALERKAAVSSCAWTSIKAEVQRLPGRDDVVPGMIAAIQTHGQLLHWHPHIHILLTCGAFTPQGEFLELPELDMETRETAWQEAIFALYLSERKIEPEVVEKIRSWQHSGFRVDQSVFLPAGDQPGIERLVRYMTHYPFSLSRLVKVTETGQVVYKAQKACKPSGRGDPSGAVRTGCNKTWAYARDLLIRLHGDDPCLEDMLPDRWAAAHPEAILNHRLDKSRTKAIRTRARRAHRLAHRT